MRPRIALMIIGFGVLAIIGFSMLRREHVGSNQAVINASSSIANPPAGSQGSESAKSNVTNTESLNQTALVATPPAPTSASNSAALNNSANDAGLTHEEVVEKRVGQLMDLGMSDDPKDLKTILSELTNSEEEIRKAAIEATKQFGSADAIPVLQQAMTNSEFAEDRQDLRDAIEFLKLPSFLAKKN